MNSKTILAISLTTLFVVSMIITENVMAAGSHLDIKKTEVEVKTNVKKGTATLEVEIKTKAKIPKDGSAGLFGYGIITDPVAFNNVLALTTHGGAFDHSSQSGASDPVFHAHVLDLAGPGSIGDPCSGVGDAVVDFASSISSANNIDAQYKVKVKGSEIEVKKVPVSDLNDAGVEGIVAFNIIGMGTDPNAPAPIQPFPWLCLDIVGIGVGL